MLQIRQPFRDLHFPLLKVNVHHFFRFYPPFLYPATLQYTIMEMIADMLHLLETGCLRRLIVIRTNKTAREYLYRAEVFCHDQNIIEA